MGQTFTAIVQKLIAEQGKEILFDAAKCQALLANYAGNGFKMERRLFLMAVEAGVPQAIDSAAELEIEKQRQIKALQDTYFLDRGTAAEQVDMLAFILKGAGIPGPGPQPKPAASRPTSAVPPAPGTTPGINPTISQANINSTGGATMYCSQCGKQINAQAVVCVHCGCAVSGHPSTSGNIPVVTKTGKSKIAAGLLGILLGHGIHNLYLGHTSKGILQLVLEIVGWVLSFVVIGIPLAVGIWIWCLVEGIQCLTGNYKDAQGNDLVD